MDIHLIKQKLLAKGYPLASDDLVFNLAALNDAALDGVSTIGANLNINLMQSMLRGKGIRISNDDPLFVLLALNKIVLENSIDQFQKIVKGAENERNTSIKITEYKTKFRIPALIAVCLLCMLIGCVFEAKYIGPQLTFVGLIGVLLGTCFGVLTSLFLIKGHCESMELPVPAIQAVKKTDDIWTEDEFNNCFNNLMSRIDDRTRQACKDVLLNGMDLTKAASKHQLFPSGINKVIIKLIESKQQIQ